MRKKERYEKILAWFRENVPVAETELHYDNPFELLIAVILSAQCTDKRVNMITPALYRDFPTPEALAATTPDVVYEYIRSVSYPNNKAKHLVGMAQMLVKDFKSEVPVQCRKRIGKTYTGNRHPYSPPLAYPSRSLCMPGTYSTM